MDVRARDWCSCCTGQVDHAEAVHGQPHHAGLFNTCQKVLFIVDATLPSNMLTKSFLLT